MRETSQEFQKIEAEALRKDFLAIVAESHEEASRRRDREPAARGACPTRCRRKDSQSRSVHRQPHRERPKGRSTPSSAAISKSAR